jgi:hypothetical protein
MSAEMSARITAAEAALADFRRWADGETVSGDWPFWAGRLEATLGLLLEGLAADPAAGQLAAIRQVLDAFDWETGDRQYALEAIEGIALGGAR